MVGIEIWLELPAAMMVRSVAEAGKSAYKADLAAESKGLATWLATAEDAQTSTLMVLVEADMRPGERL